MARLSEAQQREIVTMLARFTKPAKVQAHMKSRYGLIVPFGQIDIYNAHSPQFRAADRWRTLFEAVEKAFIEEVVTIPSAHKGFRINLLHEAALEARDRGNYALMKDLLEQAAKEVGGLLTNRSHHEIDVKDERLVAEMSEEERLTQFAALMDRVLGRDPKGKETVQ